MQMLPFTWLLQLTRINDEICINSKSYNKYSGIWTIWFSLKLSTFPVCIWLDSKKYEEGS